MIDIDRLAAELFEAEGNGEPVPLLTDRHPELTTTQARAIARANDVLHARRHGQPIGYKLGWTSAAMRDALGIDEPNWGTLWPHNLSGPRSDLAGFIHPKVEPELVFRVGAELRGRPTPETVLTSGGAWALGIEIVDPRFPSFDFRAEDNTADNSSRAGVVVGAFVPLAPERVEAVSVVFDDGIEHRSGAATQAMGSPAAAVAWLVAGLSDEGAALTPGQIVFTGGLTAPFDGQRGSTFRLASDDLAEVTLTFD